MNEEIEYAEMLEIPVSTVNVVRKKRRRKHADNLHAPTVSLSTTETTATSTHAELRDSVIAQVNGKMENHSVSSFAEGDAEMQDMVEEQALIESENSEGYLSFESEPDRLRTVRLYASGEMREMDTEDEQGEEMDENNQNDDTRYALNTQKHPSRGVRIFLNTQLALACALCGAIFFTNVFLPNSAINTFFRAIHTPKAESTAKHYSEFDLAPIVSLRSDAQLNLSPAGVLSFTDDCCVYPAANGTVKEILRTDEGLYTVKVGYTDAFTGVFYGLDTVYYAVGETVKANVPIGYTAGNVEVQVTMYADGDLLNCFELTEENCLAWIDGSEE